MRRFRRSVGLLTCAVSLILTVSDLRAGDVFFLPFLERQKPAAPCEPPVERLAKQIDWLEHYVEQYGTVVPKQPDVWGQARLTKYRQEFEREMASDVNKFQETLQGAIRRADESYMGMAMAINAATGSNATFADAKTAPQPGAVPAVSIDAINTMAAPSTDPAAKDVIPRFAPPTTLGTFVPFRKSDTNKTLQLSLEPSIFVDQKARYLNHLQQIRRINEGDDNADSPGYALNLVRIPISVLPGKKTDHGYGAEITVTATPQLTEVLLSGTFRNLVINDVVDQLALPFTQILYEYRNREDFWAQLEKAFDLLQRIKAIEDYAFIPCQDIKLAQQKQAWAQQCYVALMEKNSSFFPPPESCCDCQSVAQPPTSERSLKRQAAETKRRLFQTPLLKQALRIRRPTLPVNLPVNMPSQRRSRMPIPPSQLRDLAGEDLSLWAPILIGLHEATKTLLAQQQMVNVGDVDGYLRAELEATYDFMSRTENIHLWDHCQPDLVKYIRNRQSGVDLLKQTEQLACPEYTGDEGPLGIARHQFLEAVHHTSERLGQVADIQYAATAPLSWAILVESALLNQRLVEDMQRVAVEKNCPCLALGPENAWPLFYLPWPHSPEQGPPPEPQRQAAAVFNEYVRCRWPIVVFALDPETDDQNIADMYSARRELKIAIAAAVSTGQVSPSCALNFVRRLEIDIETIALNRTGVGFVHGNDTFGWRFYPRLQTPPNKGNLQAFWQTWAGGPTTNQMICERRLEPGIRECVAIVVMPSFVPHVTFETRSNWFCLTNPSHKEMALHDTMKISREFQAVRCTSMQLCQSGAYRPGDVERMVRSLDQIEKRLPLQTLQVPVPYENTLGGFAMFSSGITDLGPELRGWYGEPGIRVSNYASFPTPDEVLAYVGGNTNVTIAGGSGPMGTTLFLVGRHFSVHDTQVVAGGRIVPYDLLSREVMRIVVPTDVNWSLNAQNERIVDIHVATAYGISQHLFVPVAKQELPPAAPVARSGFKWALTEPLNAVLCFPDARTGATATHLAFWSEAANELIRIKPKPGIQVPAPAGVPAEPPAKLVLVLTTTLADGTTPQWESPPVAVNFTPMIDGLWWPGLEGTVFQSLVNGLVKNITQCNLPTKPLEVGGVLLVGGAKIVLEDPIIIQLCVANPNQRCPEVVPAPKASTSSPPPSSSTTPKTPPPPPTPAPNDSTLPPPPNGAPPAKSQSGLLPQVAPLPPGAPSPWTSDTSGVSLRPAQSPAERPAAPPPTNVLRVPVQVSNPSTHRLSPSKGSGLDDR